VLALPLGGVELPSIAADDIGKCAYGPFHRGSGTVGERVGIAGEVLSGAGDGGEVGRALGRKVTFNDVPFGCLPRPGLPRTEDLGNMFHVPGHSLAKSSSVAVTPSVHDRRTRGCSYSTPGLAPTSLECRSVELHGGNSYQFRRFLLSRANDSSRVAAFRSRGALYRGSTSARWLTHVRSRAAARSRPQISGGASNANQVALLI
jgi:hypothetical protein